MMIVAMHSDHIGSEGICNLNRLKESMKSMCFTNTYITVVFNNFLEMAWSWGFLTFLPAVASLTRQVQFVLWASRTPLLNSLKKNLRMKTPQWLYLNNRWKSWRSFFVLTLEYRNKTHWVISNCWVSWETTRKPALCR